jgi:hypothetical protein
MMSPRPLITLDYRRIQPAPLGRKVLHLRGVLVVLGLIAVVVTINLIMLVLLLL